MLDHVKSLLARSMTLLALAAVAGLGRFSHLALEHSHADDIGHCHTSGHSPCDSTKRPVPSDSESDCSTCQMLAGSGAWSIGPAALVGPALLTGQVPHFTDRTPVQFRRGNDAPARAPPGIA
jgi:hypothetical protein